MIRIIPLTTILARQAWRKQEVMRKFQYFDSPTKHSSPLRCYTNNRAATDDDPSSSNNDWHSSSSTTTTPSHHQPSYFQVFGLDPHYTISLDQLQQAYKKLMIKYHPDKHHRSSMEQRIESDDKSAMITRAYETLRDPQSRALHLLDVLGHPMDETSTGQLVGHDFLMEVMHVREQIIEPGSNDGHDDDDDDDKEQLKELWESNQRRIQTLSDQLARAFDDHQPPDLENAMRLTAKLQYWYRVEEKLLEQMEEIPESR